MINWNDYYDRKNGCTIEIHWTNYHNDSFCYIEKLIYGVKN
jgi:hypothetical protein